MKRNSIFISLLFLCLFSPLYSQVGIGTDSPNPKSILEMKSTTQGHLWTRLNDTEMNALHLTSTDEGMVIFNTTQKKFLGWDGTKWQNLGYEESNTPPYHSSTPTLASNNGTNVGAILTSSVSLIDAEGDTPIAIYRWERADNNSGSNTETISGATSQNYTTVDPNDDDKYIRVCVTPTSSTGASPGIEQCSAWFGMMNTIVNQAPVASSVSISGTLSNSQTLTGSYTYSDAEGDTQGTSTFVWRRADDSSGANATNISGATNSTYTLTASDVGKYVSFCVTPVATTGTTTGTQTCSSWNGPVLNLISGTIFNENFDDGNATDYFTLTYSNAANNSSDTGIVSSNSPAGWSPSNSPRSVSGTNGFMFAGSASNLVNAVFESPVINLSTYTSNIEFSMRLAAFGTSNTTGMDGRTANDFVRIEISTNGGTTYTQHILQGGNNNANWPFSATGSATANYGSSTVDQNSSAGVNTTSPSVLKITNIPNTITQFRIRITLSDSQTASTDERWVIDDLKMIAP